MPLATALLLFGVLGGSDGSTDDVPDDQEARVVRFQVADVELVAYPLRTSPDAEALVVIGQGARLITIHVADVQSSKELPPRPIQAVPPTGLVAALGHDDRFARDHAYDVLWEQGKHAAGSLQKGLSTNDPETLWRILRLLRNAPSSRAMGAVRRHLTAENERVRKEALATYDAMGGTDLGYRCLKILEEDPSELVQHEAVIRLGKLGDPTSVEPLLLHLESSESRSVQLVSYVALRRLTGQGFGRDARLWRSWWNQFGQEFMDGSMAEDALAEAP